MKKIAVFSRKGGTGKTTTSLCLGLVLREAGHNVKWLDFDPQASLTACLNHLEIPLNTPDSKVTICDFAPALESPALKTQLKSADLIIIPTGLSAIDLASLSRTLEYLKDLNSTLRNARILTNMTRSTTLEFKQREDSLGKLKAKTLKTVLPLKSSFSRIPLEGLKALTPADRELVANLALEVLA